MRGYFGVGTDGISKPMNLGNLMRIAHAFGASFFFTVGGRVRLADAQSNTSAAEGHVPLYAFKSADELRLPVGCVLVGVEITGDAIDLPAFKHPPRAAYVFGAERLSLSPAMLSRCAFVVRIPTRFSINVGMAGAIVMYDRLISEGRFPARPIRPGAPAELPPAHAWGRPVLRAARTPDIESRKPEQ
jgi:tRNA G18 (ribose-2'-O)-methylase SpoU